MATKTNLPQEKNLTQNGLTISNSILILLYLAMIGVSIYLTQHFFKAYFPSGFEESGLCELGTFWSCDHASLSGMGKIFNVPISLGGIIIGLMGIVGAIFPSDNQERTNKFFIYLNALGCLFLFIYSLIILGGLCPFCTLYYLLSFTCAFLYFKYSSLKAVPDLKITLLWGVILIVSGFFLAQKFEEKTKQKESLASQYVEKFYELKVTGDPTVDSDFRLASATDKFSDAPLRITIFSDFECPFCKFASIAIEDVIKSYQGKINVQYFFFPLDSSCNHNLERAMHPYACKAATLAACDKSKFKEIHDEIFKNQENLSDAMLSQLEKEKGLSNCMNNEEVKTKVLDAISVADTFSVNSTPVMIINGRKITAALEAVNLKAILNSLLEKGE